MMSKNSLAAPHQQSLFGAAQQPPAGHYRLLFSFFFHIGEFAI
jgi:hypothetical protein